MNESTRVLVVDEEEGMTHVLGLALGFEGWTVSTVGLGETVAQAVDDFDPHVIVLDITLPDISGVDVARSLRERGISTPIIFLTGRDTIDDRLAAYAAGGDDYLTKPFGLEEVIDRLRAILRRTGQLSTSIVAGDLVLDTETREAWRAGEALLPTRAEFDALLDETSQYAA